MEACDALYNKIVAFVQASNEANALRDENDKLKGDNAILRTKLDKARAVSDKMISQAASKEDEIRKLRQDLQEVQEKHDELVNDIAQVKRVLNKNNRKTIVTPQQARAASVQKGSSN